MGNPLYSMESRSTRSTSEGYKTKAVNDIFKQNVERKIHDSMNPKGIKLRECRNSTNHPDVLPVILGLDVTGSMRHIPHDLIKDGLPTLMSTMIQRNIDASVCFVAIGDHECDKAPIQIAQFESGDAELDMFLTRTWLEGNGGGNTGESYLLAWYFATHHVVTDAETAGKKGFLFTMGDEPCLNTLPATAIKEIFGAPEAKTWTKEELLAKAQEKYHVYHICINHGGRKSDKDWKFLDQNLLVIEDFTKIPNLIADTIASHSDAVSSTVIPAKQKLEQEIL